MICMSLRARMNLRKSCANKSANTFLVTYQLTMSPILYETPYYIGLSSDFVHQQPHIVSGFQHERVKN